MKLREIPNYLSGIKVRRESWGTEDYIYFNGIAWLDEEDNLGEDFFYDDMQDKEDWEIYQEPKLTKIITLYRHTHTYLDNSIIQSYWTSLSWERYEKICLFLCNTYTLLHTESKEIEVEDKE